jgi:hypothetical protein
MTLSRLLSTTLIVAALSFAACGDDEEENNSGTISETVTLNAAMEVPMPNLMGATPTGTFSYTMNSTTRVMTYTLLVSGLTGPAISAHIHAGAAGVKGGVLHPLFPTGTMLANGDTFAGTLTLTEEQVTTLNAAGLYVNVHTAMNTDGEIRAQLDGK